MDQQFTHINGNEIAYIGNLSSTHIIFIIGRFDFNRQLEMCIGLLTFLGHHRSIIILSHSVGGRLAANLTLHVHIKRIICFGYPFKHPEESEDKTRTEVLENIRTPFLIIQGRFDEYGGINIREKYQLSTSVEILHVDSNHDYENLSNSDWDLVTSNVSKFIELKN